MSLTKNYDPKTAEPRLEAFWQKEGVYHFDENGAGQVYSIDTPPPTVSGNLHLGHVYSYSHTDFVARFWRMKGRRVFYPMGFDDNGLPTERLVEKRLGIRAREMNRQEFIAWCLETSVAAEQEYADLWQRLGLSIDWRYSYRTIDAASQRISQISFLDLYRKGLAYQREAPSIWCPECQASFAQADLNDLERESEFVTLAFKLEDGRILPIATTRSELLPSCVAIFVHPEDHRYRHLVGKKAVVPLFGQSVPVLADPKADPQKGTGVVMCCTFGDATDVSWWYTYKLPLIQSIGRDGRMTEASGKLKGLSIEEARQAVKGMLHESGLILERQHTSQTLRVHERCDTPVEYLPVRQWFINLLDHKEELLRAGEQVNWYPHSMKARYEVWVENLNWDWCISRQRYFGVPIPVWHCQACGVVILPDEADLPVDPVQRGPEKPCPRCNGEQFSPERDLLDTWATSSMSPQIVGHWQLSGEGGDGLYAQVFPFTLRPQAHDIIRTWAFYTIAKSWYHFGVLPWKDAAISGWGIAGEGMGKISKSRGGGPLPPMETIERYGADAVRYWTSSTAPGKDAIISEEKIRMGARLVTKLWNVARFAERFLTGYNPPETLPSVSPADRWMLSGLQKLVRQVTADLLEYDYAAARSKVESFFWSELADNYLEMCKQHLYGDPGLQRDGAVFTLYSLLDGLIRLFAPFFPYVTEEIYQGLFRKEGGPISIHLAAWPVPATNYEDPEADAFGAVMVEIATAVRRYKSERNLPLGSELAQVKLATVEPGYARLLGEAQADLQSVSRAREIVILSRSEEGMEALPDHPGIAVLIEEKI